MVQYQTREAKVMTGDNLFEKLLHPDEKSAKKHVWHIRVAVALLAGSLLAAGIFVFVSGFQCRVKTGITNRQPEYTVIPNDLEKAKDYTRWVKSLPSTIICGIDCLFYNLVPENAKDEEPEFLPISKNFHVKANESLCYDIPMTMRFDCHPDASPSRSSCEERGCCWREEEIPKRKRPFPSLRLHQPAHGPSLDDLPLSVPFCYYPRDYKGYSFINFTSEIHGFNGYLKRETASGYPGDIDTLKMDVYFETETRLRIKITDPSRARWETPIPVVPEVTKGTNSTQYSFVAHLQDGTFTITRKINGLPIFDTTGMAPLTYAEQFLQLSTSLPSDYIYGLGEHLEGLLLDTYWKRRVLWNLDNVPEPGVGAMS